MPFNSSDFDLLIVSDLHLSEGRNPRTGRLSRNEDFLFDEEFARFLSFHAAKSSSTGRKWHLIINGDFFDFLQVITANFDKDFLDYLNVSSDSAARELLDIADQDTSFGLDAGPGESVVKLWKIMHGHRLMLEALAEFIEAGNGVSIGPGNHDPEFAFELVRTHFRQILIRIYRGCLLARGVASCETRMSAFEQACRERLQFLDWFYYEPGNIWVEHGGQYDSLNCFTYGLAPFLPDRDHIVMPWGSFFVRYLFNRIETDAPFADNIKPQTAFIRWLITAKPNLALRFLFRGGWYMLHKIGMAWRPLYLENRRKEHIAKRDAIEREWSLPEGTLTRIELLGSKAKSVLQHPTGGWRVAKVFTQLWPLSLFAIAVLIAAGIIGLLAIAAGVLSIAMPAAIVSGLSELLRHTPTFLVAIFDACRWIMLGYAVVGLWWFFRKLLPRKKEQQASLAFAARQLQPVLNVKVITMGHTHDRDLAPCGPAGTEYFNTGTWTKVFSEEDRLTREESELVFLEVLRKPNGLRCKLMKWCDGPGEPRLVKLFVDKTAGADDSSQAEERNSSETSGPRAQHTKAQHGSGG